MMILKQENSIAFFPCKVADSKTLDNIRETTARVRPLAFHRRTRINDEISVLFNETSISIAMNHLWIVISLKTP